MVINYNGIKRFIYDELLNNRYVWYEMPDGDSDYIWCELKERRDVTADVKNLPTLDPSFDTLL